MLVLLVCGRVGVFFLQVVCVWGWGFLMERLWTTGLAKNWGGVLLLRKVGVSPTLKAHSHWSGLCLMPSRFVYMRRVEFADTDMAGIMHFSSIFRFMESAEHAFLRSLGHSVILSDLNQVMGFPRVRAEANFRRPFRFEDEIEIELRVREKREKSLTYGFALRKAGDPSREVRAVGLITVVCVCKGENGEMAAVELPPILAEKIEVDEGLCALEDPEDR